MSDDPQRREETQRRRLASAVEVAPAPAGGVEAKACLDRYFSELADRFDAGYDPARDRSAPMFGTAQWFDARRRARAAR